MDCAIAFGLLGFAVGGVAGVAVGASAVWLIASAKINDLRDHYELAEYEHAFAGNSILIPMMSLEKLS